LRAWRVRIHRVASLGGAQMAGGVVTADRPWPKVWGGIALGISLVIAIVVYATPLLKAAGLIP